MSKGKMLGVRQAGWWINYSKRDKRIANKAARAREKREYRRDEER